MSSGDKTMACHLTGKWGGNEKNMATKLNANNSNSEANACYINSSQSAALFCADGRSEASKKEVANCPSQVRQIGRQADRYNCLFVQLYGIAN